MAEFVYVLLNPAYKGLLKIGRTGRSPEERAQELSAASGVPQSFIVAYEAVVSDGPLAERQIHEELARKGFRLNPTREFFEVPLKAAIAVVDRICASLPAESIDVVDQAETPELSAEDLVQAGISYLDGGATVFQDFEAALKCFERAAELGSFEGQMFLSDHYFWGHGTRADVREGVRLMQAGGQRGWPGCYYKLWEFYAGRLIDPIGVDEEIRTSDEHAHPQNADVAFQLYMDALSAKGERVGPNQRMSYLSWALNSTGPYAARFRAELTAGWVNECKELVRLVRQCRTKGTPRGEARGADGRELSMKPLLDFIEWAPRSGLQYQSLLVEMLDGAEQRDFEYAFAGLPAERQWQWVRTFVPYAAKPASTPAPPPSPSEHGAPATPAPAGWLRRLLG